MRYEAESIRKLPREVMLSSLLVGLFADARCINRILVSFFPLSEEGIMSYLYMAILLLLLGISMVYNCMKVTSATIFITVFLVLFYILTVFLIGQPQTPVLNFAVFTIFAFCLPCFSQVNGKMLLRIMIIAPAIGIIRVNEIFVLDDIVEKISMGLTYAFLPPIIATVVYLFTCFKDDDRKMKVMIVIVSLINLVYLFRMMLFGSRGPILAIVCVVAFLLLVRKKETAGVTINKKMAIVSVAFIIALAVSLEDILLLADSFLDKFNLDFRFIEKSLYLLSGDNFDHNRGMIATLAWKGFLDSPFTGNGLDRFLANTGIVYPHNFVLQALYDGGLLLFFVLFTPVMRGLYTKYKNCSVSEYIILTVLLFSSVPGALLSENMWKQALLWLFMGVTVSKKFIYKENVRL